MQPPPPPPKPLPDPLPLPLPELLLQAPPAPPGASGQQLVGGAGASWHPKPRSPPPPPPREKTPFPSPASKDDENICCLCANSTVQQLWPFPRNEAGRPAGVGTPRGKETGMQAEGMQEGRQSGMQAGAADRLWTAGGGGGSQSVGRDRRLLAPASTVPTYQLLGSANAETTPARAPATAADRKQRPDATCERKNG